jgi:hypothetical protein
MLQLSSGFLLPQRQLVFLELGKTLQGYEASHYDDYFFSDIIIIKQDEWVEN